MDPIPNNSARVSENVSDKCCDADERNRRQRIERFDDIDRTNHVGPENEVDDPLCPAEQNEDRPNQMPSADQRADDESDLVGTNHNK